MSANKILIKELSDHLSLPDLTLSKQNTCQVIIDSQHKINIEISNIYNSVFIYWEPEDNNGHRASEQLLRYLLCANFLGLKTNGAYFSLNSSENISLNIRLDMDDMTGNRLTSEFDKFTSAVIGFSQELALPLEIIPENKLQKQIETPSLLMMKV